VAVFGHPTDGGLVRVAVDVGDAAVATAGAGEEEDRNVGGVESGTFAP
jgi:hypothetical protein